MFQVRAVVSSAVSVSVSVTKTPHNALSKSVFQQPENAAARAAGRGGSVTSAPWRDILHARMPSMALRHGWAIFLCAAGPVACRPLVDTTGSGSDTGSTGDSARGSESGRGPSRPGDPAGPNDAPPDPGGTTGTGPGPSGSSSSGPPAKTTAGSGGDVPGGVGPGAVPDEEGDVSLPGADVVAAAVYTDGVLADFRVQFADDPFGDQTTYSVAWCLDTRLPAVGTCPSQGPGLDTYLLLIQEGPSGQFVSGNERVHPCSHTAYEADTRTLRVLVGVDEFPGTSDFAWTLNVIFGGSSGNNERVPEEGLLDVVVVDELPAFSGEPTC